MADFYVSWTTIGLAKRAAALAGGPRVAIAELALAETDGGPFGSFDPDAAWPVGVEVWRGSVNVVEVRPPDTTVVTVEAHVPASDGPFRAMVLGLFDTAGDCVAYGPIPTVEKSDPASGALSDLYVRVRLEALNPELAVELVVDPAVVMASRAYVDEWSGPAQHSAWINWR